MSPVVTYTIIAVFMVACITLLYGFSHLRRLQHEMHTTAAAASELGSAERDVAADLARERYNNAVATFPTNLVARLTGFERTD